MTACDASELPQLQDMIPFLRIVGVVLFIGAPLLALGQTLAIREQVALYARDAGRPAVGADSARVAVAAYHLARARAVESARWTPWGYGTLGAAAMLMGLTLLLVAKRRTRQAHRRAS